MIKIKIEKGIPLIKRSGNKPIGSTKYPFPNMKVGDSFIYPKGNHSNILQARICISVAAHGWIKATKNDWIFRTKKINNNEIRIWRIK